MDSNKLKTIALLVVSAIAALYLGIAAATAQIEVLLWVAGGLTLAICLALGRRIWLIIPFSTSLGLVLPLPGSFSTELFAQAITLGFCSLLFLMRRLPFRFQFTELSFWSLLFILCVVQIYLRNPVGLNIFGGESVGGKPYIVFAITCSVAFLLSILLVAPTDLRWWMRLAIIGGFLNFGIGALGKLVPSVGYYLMASFSTDVEGEDERMQGDATRVSFVRQISITLSLWISSRISPIKASFHPFWLVMVLCSLAAAAFSGFRSQLILVGLYFLVGICYWNGLKGIILALCLGSAALTSLALVNLVAPLPANIQRSLTFLPGTWDARYKDDAESSTEWRVEMWKEALFTDRWIQNKWLGDGLGFSKLELQRMAALNAIKGGTTGVSGLSSGQETMMISGGYHSGPVQTIRTVGYVGLSILLIGMFRVAVHAHRQIVRTRGTEWFPVAIFICLPFIVGPIFWITIIGSFDGGGRMLLLGTAMISMLEKNLPLPAYIRSRRMPYVLSAHRNREGLNQPTS